MIAKAVHWGLYVLLASMVVVGMALTWTRGDSIFNLFTLPAFDPGNRALADQVQEVHAAIGWIIVAIAGLHAAAALFHRYVRRDGVLGRMLPRGSG
jgi:cytochrome b561